MNEHPYICSNCGSTFDRDGLFAADVDIGSYEAWGHRYRDHCLAVLSRCCEANVMFNDGHREQVTLDDL